MLCADELPLGPRPIVRLDRQAKILVVGQAPGRKVHESGIPFDDASGDQFRDWMGIGREPFLSPHSSLAILPMGSASQGTGSSGDLPPRPECGPTWRRKVLDQLGEVQLTLVIGQYAQRYHLPDAGRSVTDTVRSWEKLPATGGAIASPQSSKQHLAEEERMVRRGASPRSAAASCDHPLGSHSGIAAPAPGLGVPRAYCDIAPTAHARVRRSDGSP